MEDLRALGLVKLHRDLMDNLNHGTQDELSNSIRFQIDALGWLTQELVVNCAAELDGSTPLLAASARGKWRAVDQLLQRQAVPSIVEFVSILRSKLPHRQVIAEQLLRHARPAIIQRVLWLACQHNEVALAKACLELGACPDSQLWVYNCDKDTPDVWIDTGPPTPLLYAASQGYTELFKTLEKYGADTELSDDDDIGCLTLAAFGRHIHLVEHLTSVKAGTDPVDKANAYEILGAAHVIAGDVAAGKNAWKKAICILEKEAHIHKSRHVARMNSLNTKLGFREPAELDRMRAKEFRIQALIVFERHLFGSRLFIEGLLAAPYTIDVSIEALFIILKCDKLTVENLSKIQVHLEKLGFFKATEINKVMLCLEWCITAVGHLRDLVQIYPVSWQDLVRYKALVKFTCQVLICLEGYSRDELNHPHLHHLLRRIVGVCHPMAHVYSLLHCLLRNRLKQGAFDENNIFDLLVKAGADMVVFDANQNTLLHEAVIAHGNDLPFPKHLVLSLIHAEVPLTAINRKGVSVEKALYRFLDCTS